MGNNLKLQIIKKCSSFKKCIDLHTLFSTPQPNLCDNSRFTYPKQITLINGNIFIIHQTGIEIYYSSYTKLEQTIRTFTENEKISDTIKQGKVSITRFSQNDNGLII